jgi:hypothetical protein
MPELQRMAEEVSRLPCRRDLEDGETIPDPSALDAVMLDPDYNDGVPILVTLQAVVLAK